MQPQWIRNAYLKLMDTQPHDDEYPPSNGDLAEAVFEALPLQALVQPCADSLRAQLAQRLGVTAKQEDLDAMARNIVQAIAGALGEL